MAINWSVKECLNRVQIIPVPKSYIEKYKDSWIKNWEYGKTEVLDKSGNNKVWWDVEHDSYVRSNPMTEFLIWNLGQICMGHITAKNVIQVYTRFYILNRIGKCKPYRQPWEEEYIEDDLSERFITPYDIASHVGMTTNHSDLAFSKWKTKVMDKLIRNASREFDGK